MLDFFNQALAPLYYLVDPTRRLFFVYLLTSFVIAFVVLIFQGHSTQNSLRHIFNKKVWNHSSSRLDLELLFFNSLIRATLFLFVVASSVVVAREFATGLYYFFPDWKPWSFSYQTWMLLYSVVSFVVLDFTRFLQHYLFHKVPLLWRFHAVHHSARVLTPLTLYRNHPVESCFSSLRRVLVIGVLSGLFIFLSRSMIGVYAVLGINALDFIFNIFGSNLRHSHIWLSFGPLNHILMSPAQHQIHHSRASRHFDKNLGFALSIWDKLFGTFHQVGKREFLRFGVKGQSHGDLFEAVVKPFRSQ